MSIEEDRRAVAAASPPHPPDGTDPHLVQLTGAARDIVEAAVEVVRERGLTAATTRAIAQRAGCSEGLIYRYFPDKIGLLMTAVATRYPDFLELMYSLPERAGTRTVQRNLEDVAIGALRFMRAIVPMVGGAVAQRELLEAQREWFRVQHKGPLNQLAILTEHLAEERKLGRISSKASPELAARLLLGTCFAQAFLIELMGPEAEFGTDERFARGIVRTVLEGIKAP